MSAPATSLDNVALNPEHGVLATLVRVKTPDRALAQTVLARLGLIPDSNLVDPHSENVDWVSAPVEPYAAATAAQPDLIVRELVAAGVRVYGFAVEESSPEKLGLTHRSRRLKHS
jgi:hypothetical protein